MQAAAQLAMKAGANDAVKDPMCGMEIDRAKAAEESEYNGKTYYFCSRSCKEMFDKDPKRYADSKPTARL